MIFPFIALNTLHTQDAQPTIVLVHGAFANASAWTKVIPMLQKHGYAVRAVQMPMSSYADDVAATNRVLESIKGPVVLVGHSYGGAVISGASTANVKALVYINAFGPDENETLGGVQAGYAATPLATALVPDSAGYLTIDPAKFHAAFCADVPESEAAVMAVTQGPLNSSAFGAPMPVPAWKTVPSFYMVGKSDKAINPDLERFFAKRMKATTVEVEASHVPFLSHPGEVDKLIEQAAKSVSG